VRLGGLRHWCVSRDSELVRQESNFGDGIGEDEAMAAFTYPGVYIEELQSGQHTITGVATSIAVFIGWTTQGPVKVATLVQSWSDYQATFGGLTSASSYLSYAVNQFFGNGGTQAYIVRIVADADTTGATQHATTATHDVSTLKLFASSPGAWGNNIQVTITPSSADATRFSLLVQSVIGSQTTTLESYANLSAVATDSQYVVSVIDSDSNNITFIDPSSGTVTAPASAPVSAKVLLGSGTKAFDGDILDPTDTSGKFLSTLKLTSGNASTISWLDSISIFNIVCIPGESDATTLEIMQAYCTLRRAFLLIDAPPLSTVASLATSGPVGTGGTAFSGQYLSNSAYYFPWVMAPDPLVGNRPKLFPPCGFVAGIYASTDASRGVWKAPAGINASLSGVLGLQYAMSDAQNGSLNPQAINCLRQFKVYGDVVWGARTLAGNDQAGSQWKYVPIRRLALFLESSLYEGTQWVVFEPNDETLWGQVRMNIGTFLQGIFLEGAFAGTTPQQAYFVKCDSENNPAASVALGVVNILVGFAPLYPAEFVVIQIQQIVNQN
jgi:phage tail sheath protein FI